MTARSVSRSGVGWRVWRRQIRHQPAIAVTVGVTTLLAAMLVSAAPRVVEHASVADVRNALSTATPEERNIRFQFDGRIGFESLDRRSNTLLGQELPDSVADIVADRQWMYDSPTFTVRSFPEQVDGPFPTTFRFRYQEGLDDQMSIVRGRLPELAPRVTMLAGSDCPTDGTTPDEFEPGEDQECSVIDVPVFETAITEQMATDMMVDVGDRVTLTPAGSDVVWRRASSRALGAIVVLQISGIVELTDPASEYWFADSSLHRPRITENSDFRLIGAVGLLMPRQYDRFVRDVLFVDLRYTWRFIVDPDLVTSADAARLASEVERISPEGYVTRTLLPEVLSEHIAQRRLTVQLMSTSAAGMFSVAIAAVVALLVLGAIRQRSSIELAIDRGASRAQLRVNAVRTAVVVVLLPAIVGWSIAWRSLPATPSGPATRAALAVAIVALVAVIASSVPARSMGGATDDGRRRIVVEAMLVVAAVGSVLVLRQRGSVDERVGGGFDLLLISAPALLALSAGLLAARFVGPVARAGAAVGRRRRTLGTFVGFRRLVVQPSSARMPVIVMTIAVATAVLSAVLASSVEAGQRSASWQLIGGDYRVQTFVDDVPLPVALDAAVFDGRSPVFGAELLNQRVGEGAHATTVDVVGIDAAAYGTMLDRADLGVGLDELGDPPTEGAVPALAVGRWPARAGPEVGELLGVTLGAFTATVEVMAIVDRFPGLSPGRAGLVVDLDALRGVTNDRLAQPSFVVLDGDRDDLAEISRLVDDGNALVTVTSRFERLDAIAGDPFSTWTNRTLWSVTAISLAFVVVAAVSAAAIASASRRRDLALLRVLGLRPREHRLITMIEHVPTLLASIGFGCAVGIVTGVLLEPTLGLSAFAGGGTEVGLRIDGIAIAGLVVTMGVAAALGVAVSQLITRQKEGAKMLRVGDP